MLDLFFYVVLVAVSRVLRAIPFGPALAIGRGLASLAFHVVRFRRRVVIANLRHVFAGRKSDEEILALARDAYRQFGMTVVEVLRCVGARDVRSVVAVPEIEALERLQALQAAKTPVIICAPHLANFDLAAYACGLRGLTVHAVMKPVESERVNRLLVETREGHGLKLLMADSYIMMELAELLAAGEWIGLLPDQNAKRRGVTVDFLGKPASLYRGAAALHLETGAQIVIGADERSTEDPRRHFVRVVFVPPHAPTNDPEADVRAIMQDVATRMGELILRNPGQYFWFHRLWGKNVAAASRSSA